MMFRNSLKYIAPLFPSRILSPLLPSFKLPSFNFLSLRFIDSYGFTLNQKNYHEIPYNHEHKLNVLKNVPKISFDHDSKENQNQNENKNNVSSDAKNNTDWRIECYKYSIEKLYEIYSLRKSYLFN